MSKIIIGICGIGQGHLNRGLCIIDLLLKHNHKVVVVTDMKILQYLKKRIYQ